MSQLHDALKSLAPIDYSDVPLDNLDAYLRDTFAQAELIANSVPLPPGGDAFTSSSRSRSDSTPPEKASDLTPSSARLPDPRPASDELRKSWGKPVKISAKENPLGISVYKMAGRDRHGAWFARSSVHEGLSFTKWKKAMQREFLAGMAAKGGPGAGAVRGIAADRRLAKRKVEGVGTMEVFHLSAQFPGPVAPRDFVTLLLTTDKGLSDSSAVQSRESAGTSSIPRHYMVVSKPVLHPDAPETDSPVRGKYESVELIREIPLFTPKNPSSEDSSNGATTVQAIDEADLNPVEWIMVTRSDPGGGIPRFMVERGTPGAMVADASRFLDWACGQHESPDEDADEEALEDLLQQKSEVTDLTQVTGHAEAPERRRSKSPTAAHEPHPPGEGGILSTITGAVQAGIVTYAPTAIRENLPGLVSTGQDGTEGRANHTEDGSDTSSVESFASAEQYNGPEIGRGSPSTDSLRTTPSASSAVITGGRSRAASHHERELQKLEEKKRQADEKLRQKREKEDKRLAETSEQEEKELQRIQERHEKELKKQVEKHQKEVAKIEERKAKEQKKLEEKRRKALEKDAVIKAQRERDEWKEKAQALEKENNTLNEQVATLQQENAVLTKRIGSTEGEAALRVVKDEVVGRSRASSRSSIKSVARTLTAGLS